MKTVNKGKPIIGKYLTHRQFFPSGPGRTIFSKRSYLLWLLSYPFTQLDQVGESRFSPITLVLKSFFFAPQPPASLIFLIFSLSILFVAIFLEFSVSFCGATFLLILVFSSFVGRFPSIHCHIRGDISHSILTLFSLFLIYFSVSVSQ